MSLNYVASYFRQTRILPELINNNEDFSEIYLPVHFCGVGKCVDAYLRVLFLGILLYRLGTHAPFLVQIALLAEDITL